jgi:hypothetical protein
MKSARPEGNLHAEKSGLFSDNIELLAFCGAKKSWAPQLLLRYSRLTNFCRGFIVTDLISAFWNVPAWSSGLRFIPDSSLVYVSSAKFTAGRGPRRLSPWICFLISLLSSLSRLLYFKVSNYDFLLKSTSGVKVRADLFCLCLILGRF